MTDDLSDLSDVAAFYDELGKKTLSAWEDEYKTHDDVQTACHIVGHTNCVLDLACGYGRVSLALAELGCEVYGLDISPVLIADAKADSNHLKNLHYSVGDMRELPYEESFFDKVLCFWASFAHLIKEGDQLACLNEIYRVLKPEGYCFMVLMDPSHEFWQTLLSQSDSRVVFPQYYKAHPPIFVHNEETLKDLVGKTSFEKFELERRTMNHSKRLVMHLYKR